jgi:hypothetical protein
MVAKSCRIAGLRPSRLPSFAAGQSGIATERPSGAKQIALSPTVNVAPGSRNASPIRIPRTHVPLVEPRSRK